MSYSRKKSRKSPVLIVQPPSPVRALAKCPPASSAKGTKRQTPARSHLGHTTNTPGHLPPIPISLPTCSTHCWAPPAPCHHTPARGQDLQLLLLRKPTERLHRGSSQPRETSAFTGFGKSRAGVQTQKASKRDYCRSGFAQITFFKTKNKRVTVQCLGTPTPSQT